MFELNEGVKVAVETDRLGGNRVKESGLYPVTVEMAYISKADSGAMAVNLHLTCEDKSVYKEIIYISSGDAKGNSFTYKDKKTGDEVPLPGYAMIDTLCKLATGKGLDKMDTCKKFLSIYNFTEKKDVNTEVDVIEDLLDTKIIAGIIKLISDKKKNVAGPGEKKNYQSTGETREGNEVDKWFHAEDGRTVGEMVAKAETSAFHDKWGDLNTGKTRDTSSAKKSGAKAGAPAAAAETGETLFV